MPLPVPNILRALAAALVAGLVAPAPARPADGCSPDTAARALPPSTAASAAAGPAPSPFPSPSARPAARPAAHGVAPTAARPSRPQPTCRPAPAEDPDDDLVAAWQRISAAQDPAAMRRAARR